MELDKERLTSLPKVLLHEHLDGVLRPQTVIDLARKRNTRSFPPAIRRRWPSGFIRARTREASPSTWKAFPHTIAVMQTEEALERVAYEQAEDLSQDGVVYFETRFAPVFHTTQGIDPPAGGLGRA